MELQLFQECVLGLRADFFRQLLWSLAGQAAFCWASLIACISQLLNIMVSCFGAVRDCARKVFVAAAGVGRRHSLLYWALAVFGHTYQLSTGATACGVVHFAFTNSFIL